MQANTDNDAKITIQDCSQVSCAYTNDVEHQERKTVVKIIDAIKFYAFEGRKAVMKFS